MKRDIIVSNVFPGVLITRGRKYRRPARSGFGQGPLTRLSRVAHATRTLLEDPAAKVDMPGPGRQAKLICPALCRGGELRNPRKQCEAEVDGIIKGHRKTYVLLTNSQVVTADVVRTDINGEENVLYVRLPGRRTVTMTPKQQDQYPHFER
jgi:hypothetical protein